MIVKFIRRSKERGSSPINYLLGKDLQRDKAKVLSGDPFLTKAIIDASPYVHKYKSGCLSFSEKATDFTDEQKKQLMQEFEQTLFPGMEPDQYNVLWVEHSDKDGGRLELNFLIPCIELRSGKHLQPYYKGTDLKRVNAWKNIVNKEVKTIDGQAISDPNDPKRKRLVNKYIGTAPTPYDAPRKSAEDDKLSDRDSLRQWIDAEMIERHERNELRNRQSVIHALNDLGVTIERTVKGSITITHPDVTDKNGKPQRIRLKGGLYAEDYNPAQYTPQAQERYKDTAYSRKIKDEDVYRIGLEIKTEQLRERYSTAEIPPPLELTAPKTTTAPTAPTNRPRPR